MAEGRDSDGRSVPSAWHGSDVGRQVVSVTFTWVDREGRVRPARGERLREQMTVALQQSDTYPVAALVAAWLQSKSGSVHTRDAYATDVEQWSQWLLGNGVPLLHASRLHVETWLDVLRHERRNKPSTLARKLASVTSLYQYLRSVGAVTQNPAADVTVAHAQQSMTSAMPLSPAVAARLFDVAAEQSAMAGAFVALMLFGGLRVHEVSRACCDDVVTLDDGSALLQVLGKGSKRRDVPFSGLIRQQTERHWHDRGCSHGPLLVAEDGRPLDRHRMSYALRTVGPVAGAGTTVTPHRLRATFVTVALDSGVPLRDVQIAVGHSDPRTTVGYHQRAESWRTHPAATVEQAVREAVSPRR